MQAEERLPRLSGICQPRRATAVTKQTNGTRTSYADFSADLRGSDAMRVSNQVSDLLFFNNLCYLIRAEIRVRSPRPIVLSSPLRPTPFLSEPRRDPLFRPAHHPAAGPAQVAEVTAARHDLDGDVRRGAQL